MTVKNKPLFKSIVPTLRTSSGAIMRESDGYRTLDETQRIEWSLFSNTQSQEFKSAKTDEPILSYPEKKNKP